MISIVPFSKLSCFASNLEFEAIFVEDDLKRRTSNQLSSSCFQLMSKLKAQMKRRCFVQSYHFISQRTRMLLHSVEGRMPASVVSKRRLLLMSVPMSL